MNFSHKLVAVLNKNLPTGVALNALGHMALGFGADLGKSPLLLDTYKDKDGNMYPNISRMPFIILRATPNEIRKTVKAAQEKNIPHSAFLNTMTGGGYQEQLDTTAQTPEESLIYYGCVLFGPFEQVHELTRKLSLWKD